MSLSNPALSEEGSLDAPAEEGPPSSEQPRALIPPLVLPLKSGAGRSPTQKKKTGLKKCHRRLKSADDPESFSASIESAVPHVIAALNSPSVAMETGSPSPSSQSPMDPLRVTLNLSRQSTNPASGASSEAVDTPTATPTHSDQGEIPPLKITLPMPIERTVSEDSDTSIGMDKTCSLCYRGERSLLGQGDLSRYEPTPGFNAFKQQVRRRGSLDMDEKLGDRSPKHLTWRRNRGPPKNPRDRGKSPRRSQSYASAGGSSCNVDELNLVGLPDDVDVAHVFEKSGHVYAHHCCAAWSEGVLQADDCSLQYVDRAVLTGLSQKCTFCKRYGATIQCRYPKCSQRFHYPCASGGGCFQDIKTLSLLCPDHIDQAESIAGPEALCIVCDVPGCISDQLFCTSCGQHYHGNCLDPPVQVNPVVRSGWQCPECKICQTCRQPGDDNKMLVCDTCDKGYHIFCLRPVMTTIPKNGWKCKNCRVCGDCGSRTPGSGPSSRWHLNFSVCDSCYQQRNKGLCCPLCRKAYRHFTQKQMAQCKLCKKYVHSECDGSLDMTQRGALADYICPVCKNRDGTERVDFLSLTESLAHQASIESDHSLQDIEGFSIFKGLRATPSRPIDPDGSFQESLMTEESVSSMDIDLSLDQVQQYSSLPASSIAASNSNSLPPSRSSSPKPVGHGLGKPFVGKKLGKKITSTAQNRPKVATTVNRSVSIGKKNSKQRPEVTRNRSRKTKTQKSSLGGFAADQASKDDDSNATAVVCSRLDRYVLSQDLCVSCGSLGANEESRLIVCSQCGQCYHPYCANVKLSRIILEKGWRCLDCTVCEGCGRPHDESRLILCDECDISYHIYCLDPPLESVPRGTWKCKWCAICVTCGTTAPGTNCAWQNNYSQCGPCYSTVMCPLCYRSYKEDDLLMQCGNCDRWVHAGCDGLRNEDDTERAAVFGYHCALCRPLTGNTGPLPPLPSPEPMSPVAVVPELPPPPPPPLMFSKATEPYRAPKTYYMDGVILYERGLTQIKTQVAKIMEKRKPQRRLRRGSFHQGEANQRDSGIHQPLSRGWDVEGKEEADDLKPAGTTSELLDIYDTNKAPSSMLPSPDANEALLGDDIQLSPLEKGPLGEGGLGGVSPSQPPTPNIGLPVGGLGFEKKRKRIRIGMGVGGFMARQRSRGFGGGRGSRGGMMGPPGRVPSFDEDEPRFESDGRRARGRRRQVRPRSRKSQLTESFPDYLQEAFFGKELVDSSREENEERSFDFQTSDDNLEDSKGTAIASQKDDPFSFQSSPPRSRAPSNARQPPRASVDSMSLDAEGQDSDKEHNIELGELNEILPPELLGTEESELMGIFTSDDIDQENPDDTGEADSKTGDSQHLEGMLNPSNLDPSLLDKNLDSDLLPRELMQIDSKTLDDILKDDLDAAANAMPHHPKMGDGFKLPPLPSPSLQRPTTEQQMLLQQQQQAQPMGHHIQGPRPPMQHPGSMAAMGGMQEHMAPRMSPMKEGAPMYGMQAAPGGHSTAERFSLQFAQALHGQAPQPEEVPVVEEGERISYNKRNIMKWEKDEEFGENATISPVLYANLAHPELKSQFPEWSERAKQIAKLWRKVPADQRAPYLAKARENRATNRQFRSSAKPPTKIIKKRKDDLPPLGMPPGGPPSVPPPSLGASPATPDQGLSRDGEMSQSSSQPGTPHAGTPVPGTPVPGTPIPDEKKQGTPDSESSKPGDPYAMHAHTPSSQSPTLNIRPLDPYSQPPGTPHPNASQPFPTPPRPMSVTSPQDVFRAPRPPLPGRVSCDGYSPSFPMDPRFMGRPSFQPPPPDPYAMQPRTPMPGSSVDPFAAKSYAVSPGTPRHPSQDADSEPRYPPSEQNMEQNKAQEMQKQQLRELLAKQTKQRQSKKKHDEEVTTPPIGPPPPPPRGWPQEEGPPPPGPPAGPHGSPYSQEMEQYGPGHMQEMGPGGVGSSPGPVRLIRPPNHPGHPGYPRGPPSYPPGYGGPHGHPPYMDMRHPMFQERLRQQGAQGPRGEALGPVPGGSPPPGLRLRMPLAQMGPRAPRPRLRSPGTSGTPDQQQFHDPMMRAAMMQQQQQLRATMQQQQRPPMMMQQQQQIAAMRPNMRPNAPAHHGPMGAQGPDDDQLDDLIGADGSFNLLEYADADLDLNLIEEHDKNMFDEHLGIKQPGEEGQEEGGGDGDGGGGEKPKVEVDKPAEKKEEIKTEEEEKEVKEEPAETSAPSTSPPKKSEEASEVEKKEEVEEGKVKAEPKIPQVDGAFDDEDEEDREVQMLLLPQYDGPSDEKPGTPAASSAPETEAGVNAPPETQAPAAPQTSVPGPPPQAAPPEQQQPTMAQFHQQQMALQQQQQQQQQMRHPMHMQRMQVMQQQQQTMMQPHEQQMHMRGQIPSQQQQQQMQHFHNQQMQQQQQQQHQQQQQPQQPQQHPQMQMQRIPVSQGPRGAQPQPPPQGQPLPSSHPMMQARSMAPPPPYPGRSTMAMGPGGQQMPQRAQMMAEQQYRLRHPMYMARQQMVVQDGQVYPPAMGQHMMGPRQAGPQSNQQRPMMMQGQAGARHTVPPNHLPVGAMPPTQMMQTHRAMSPHAVAQSPRALTPGAQMPGHSPVLSPHPGQSPHHPGLSPHHQSPASCPSASPLTGLSPRHGQSPHPGQSPHIIQSPHQSPQMTGGKQAPLPHPGGSPHHGMSPLPVKSPLPKASPLPMPGQPANIYQAQTSSPRPGPSPHPGMSPHPHAGTSPHPGASPHHANIQSPLPHSRSTTPQLQSPWGSQGHASQPSTPHSVVPPCSSSASTPNTPGAPTQQPLTPGASVEPSGSQAPVPSTPSKTPPQSAVPPPGVISSGAPMSSAEMCSSAGIPPATAAAGMVVMPPHHGMGPMTSVPGVPPSSLAALGAMSHGGMPPMSTMHHMMPQSSEAGMNSAPEMAGMPASSAAMPPAAMLPASAAGLAQMSSSAGEMMSSVQGFPPGHPMHQQRMPIMSNAGPMPPQTATAPFSGHRMMDPAMLQQMQRPGMQMHYAQQQPQQPQQQQPQRMMYQQQMPPEIAARMRMQHFQLQQQQQQQGAMPPRQMYPPQAQPPRMMSPPQRPRMQPPMAGVRPRLLDEQPLLLEDLLEQEKLEQRRQAEQQALLQQQQPPSTTSAPVTTATDTPVTSGAMLNLSEAELDKLKLDMIAQEGGAAAQQQQVATSQPPPQHPVPQQLIHGPRLQHPPEGWPKGKDPPVMGMPAGYPPGPRGPTTPQMSPRTPSPFMSPSPGIGPGGMYPRLPSPGMQSPPMMPPQKPPVPTFREVRPDDPLTEEEQHQQMAYEEWLMQQANFLGGQVRTLESQVTKLRRQKKSLTSKQKQAKKNGAELAEPDLQTLERTTGELSRLQKQLEGQRKQQRSHQQAIQDYRAKQQERFGPNWPGQVRGPIPGTPMPPGGPISQGPMSQGGPMPQGPGGPMPPGAMTPGGPMPQGPMTQGGPMPHGPMTQGGPIPQGPMTQGGPMPQGPMTPGAMMQGPMSQGKPMNPQGGPMPQSPMSQGGPSGPMPPGVMSHGGPMPQGAMSQAGPMPPGGPMSQGGPMPQVPMNPGGPLPPMTQGGPQMTSPPPPRMPGSNNGSRLTSSARLEYEHYMQGRLRMSAASLTTAPSVRATTVVSGDENNPFSESYQQRQQLEQQQKDQQRMHMHPHMHMEAEMLSPEQMAAQPRPGFDPGAMSPRARFPGPRFPGDIMQRGMVPRMPQGPRGPVQMQSRLMSPTGGSNPPEVPQSPGFPMGQGLPPRGFSEGLQPGLPSPVHQSPDLSSDKLAQSTPSTPSDLATPTNEVLPAIPGEKPKKKRKRRKKKEIEAGFGTLGEMEPMMMMQQQQQQQQQQMGPAGGLGGPHPGMPQSPIQAGPVIGPDGRPMFPPGMPMHRPPMPQDMPPGSGMSELQKLVNMQPPPGMEELRHEMSPRGHMPPTAQPLPPHMGGIPPQDDVSMDGTPEDVSEGLLDLEGDISHNLLLKKLLANPRGKDGRFQVDEEERVKLTPEQQRQLALIESMPLTMETEVSQEQWELKTPEEKERIIELRRQEFERRRKEIAEAAGRKGQPRQRKKRKDAADLQGLKKRPRKGFPLGPPSPKLPMEEVDYNAISELIIQQLRSLPPLSLQEPDVPASRSICPLNSVTAPTSPVPDPDLVGPFGCANIEGTSDYYGDLPFSQQNASPLLVKNDIKEEQTNGQCSSADKRTQGEERQLYQTGISRAPFAGIGSSDRPPSIGAHDKIPSPPLIEPRPHLMSRASDQSPATIISSSSPECAQLADVRPHNPLLPLTGLRLISEDSQDSSLLRSDCQSPEIDVIKPVPIKVQPKDEPDLQQPKMEPLVAVEPMRENQLSVTLTMSSRAAEDIGGVLNAIADLLKIAVPPSFEVSRSPSPDLFSFARHAAARHMEEKVDLQTLIKSRMKFCRHCDVAVMTGVRKKKSDIPYLGKEEFEVNKDDEMMFCSEDCYEQFATAHRHARESQMAREELNAQIEALRLKQLQLLAAQTQSPEPMAEKLRLRRASSLTVEPKYPPITERKWAGLKYKKWDATMMKVGHVAPPPTEQELLQLMTKLGQTIRCVPDIVDKRTCVLCHVTGDVETDGPGRLLHLSAEGSGDKWVHLNCALWSYEVYETMNGSLVNVDQACKRGASLQCVVCSQSGATVGCFKLRCTNAYHVRCAQAEGVIFFQDKTILCPQHTPKLPENVLPSLAVFRRVYVSREEDKQIASFVHQEEKNSVIRVGSLIVYNVGQLLPTQMHSGIFNTRDYIYPVGFHSCRFYWSSKRVHRRCRYICCIDENDNRPEFSVTVKERGHEDVTFKGDTCSGVWQSLLENLSRMRLDLDLVKMFPLYLSGEDLFGLTDSNVVRMLESLPGIELITNYTFRYGRSPLFELPLAINPTGSARSEPKLRTPFKRPHTLHGSSNTRSIPATVTLVPGDSTMPYMKQFVHSKSQQYRRLKTEWRINVYLRRSNVQGLGLFASRDLERHTMVIEYIGELIRSEVAEARERVYDSQNRGVYMFRIDDNTVVDATMTGGPARYINHSCAPNCVAEVVPFEKDSKIIIIARRRIARGEELTYDYKFDFEDDQHKIPCLCGAPNCRKWMN